MGSEDDIRKHLYRKGFQPNYWVWSSHGEGSTSAPVSFRRASTSRINEPVAVPQNYQHYDPFNEMNSMITNALGYNVSIYVPNDVHEPEEDDYDGDVQVERPNEEAQRFYDLLQETNKPLFEGSLDSKLTVCIRLIGMKCRQVPEDTMNLITKLMLDVTLDHPKDLPKDYYEAKQLVAKLGLGVKIIDCCVNGCMLYYNNEFGVSDGPSCPTAGIDIYLQPLIDDLKRMWNGVPTYDISQKRNFNMKGALMWTTNDFPAYGMLSGWGTHGKLGCPICMMDTKSFWLEKGGKATWFDCHRRFLPLDHPFRRSKVAFVKGINPQESDAQINSRFPAWFKQYMYLQTPVTRIIQHLRNLADGPKSIVKEWHTYFVNGYKFHTRSWTEGKAIVNSGVCMKGVTENGEGDFYGVIEHIFEIEYNYLDYKKTVVLFYCNWFDPSSRVEPFDRLCVQEEGEEVPSGGDLDEDDEVHGEDDGGDDDEVMNPDQDNDQPQDNEPPHDAGRGRGHGRPRPRPLRERVVRSRFLEGMPKSRDVNEVQEDYDSFDDDDDHEDEEIDEALLLDPEEELLVDRYHRAIIMPYSAREFQPQNPASKAINYALKSKFQHPYENWTAVKENKDGWNQFWNGFREKVTWHRRHRAAIKSIFNKKAAKRLSGLLSDARKMIEKDPSNLPKWLAGGSSSTLVSKWASPEYQAKCQRNKQNRDTEQAKSSCVHLGGSRSAATLRIQFIKKYGRAPTFMEMNALMHKYADSDDWAGPRAEEVARLTAIYTEEYDAGQRSLPPHFDPYGIRDIADDSSYGSHRSTGRSQPSQETDEEYEERLRAVIREDLRAYTPTLKSVEGRRTLTNGQMELGICFGPCSTAQEKMSTTLWAFRPSPEQEPPKSSCSSTRMMTLVGSCPLLVGCNWVPMICEVFVEINPRMYHGSVNFAVDFAHLSTRSRFSTRFPRVSTRSARSGGRDLKGQAASTFHVRWIFAPFGFCDGRIWTVGSFRIVTFGLKQGFRLRWRSKLRAGIMADEVQRKILVEDNIDWVAYDPRTTPSKFEFEENFHEDLFTDIEIPGHANWEVRIPGARQRICFTFKNGGFPMYQIAFEHMGLRLPFTDLEVAIFNHLELCPSQLHPNSLAFICAFEIQHKKFFVIFEESLRGFKDKWFVVCPITSEGWETIIVRGPKLDDEGKVVLGPDGKPIEVDCGRFPFCWSTKHYRSSIRAYGRIDRAIPFAMKRVINCRRRSDMKNTQLTLCKLQANKKRREAGGTSSSMVNTSAQSSPSKSIDLTGEKRIPEGMPIDKRPPKSARTEAGGGSVVGGHKLVPGRPVAEFVIPPAMGHECLVDGKTSMKISDADQSILASIDPESIRNVVAESSVAVFKLLEVATFLNGRECKYLQERDEARVHAKDFGERLSAVEKDLSSETKALKESQTKVTKLEKDLRDAKEEEERLKGKVVELEEQVSQLSLGPAVEEEEKKLDPEGTYAKSSWADLIAKIYQISDLQLDVASSSFKNALAHLQVLNPDVQLVTEGMDEMKEVRDGQIATPPLEDEE
ncbi:hypothetical protein TSUD_63080 [Trifolium subterraneum]|uniref:DUF4216 domain-containing protein n=1 Tax=Trifolium subterraneum TaxID=3900 RepID=A0A2Z6MLD9_TRISU|nr:hypothetical protein TSUD_63080 [Trifolium subterraneum]